jgi:hypothetical protein
MQQNLADIQKTVKESMNFYYGLEIQVIEQASSLACQEFFTPKDRKDTSKS